MTETAAGFLTAAASLNEKQYLKHSPITLFRMLDLNEMQFHLNEEFGIEVVI